jgi:hypothetical protein
MLIAVLMAACSGPGAGTVAPPTSSPSSPSSPASQASQAATAAALPTAVATEASYAPQPRSSAAMTWDPVTRTIVMFGGDAKAGVTNAFDAWNGSTWSRLAGVGPAARNDARLVADPARGVITLSGGRSGQRTLGDMWEWDGSAWTQKSGAGPEPRAHAASAWDPVSKRVILYGGVTDADTLRDTWAWDGTAWTRLDDRGIPGLVPNGMAWDAVRKQLLVLAVDLSEPTATHTYPSQLWGWTGTAWTLVSKDGPAFSPLQQFVEGPEHPWLVDGGVEQGTFATYEWDGTTWASRGTGAGPSIRNGHAAAFDLERGQLVLFGGFNGNAVFGDTWRFDEGAWHRAAGV